ncbi:MAG: hypothetical protein A2Y23_06910 [Clostridiales bacterium GWB2_37_7]|nr:MAG: hypothetical protein A2Y23_06910 [Clostridiales bacterium GWB2_37_7]
MFGYIIPDKPELKMKEYEMFRAYYCGVCKSMGRSFGPISRFALNYEAVFLGLLLSAVNKENSVMKKEGCFANPFKKKWVIKNNKYVDFAADINVLLTYYKLIDNWQDERHFASYAGKLLFKSGYNRAFSKNSSTASAIISALEKQKNLEQKKCSSIDEAAEPTAEMIRDVLLIGCKNADENVQKSMEWLGYNLGKWIYTIDAYDDIEKDIKSGSYNPLLLQYDYKQQPIVEFKNAIKLDIERDLLFTLSQAASVIELLDMNNKGIIENIVYMGMNNKTNKILCGDCSQCDQQQSKGVDYYEKSL